MYDMNNINNVVLVINVVITQGTLNFHFRILQRSLSLVLWWNWKWKEKNKSIAIVHETINKIQFISERREILEWETKIVDRRQSLAPIADINYRCEFSVASNNSHLTMTFCLFWIVCLPACLIDTQKNSWHLLLFIAGKTLREGWARENFSVENSHGNVENSHIQKKNLKQNLYASFHDVSLQSVSSKQTVTMSESVVNGNWNCAITLLTQRLWKAKKKKNQMKINKVHEKIIY